MAALPWEGRHTLGLCVVFLQSSVLQHPSSSPGVPCLLSGTREPLWAGAQRAGHGHSQGWQQMWGCVKGAVPKARLWQCIPALLQAGQGALSRRMALPAGTDCHLLYLIEFGRLFFMAYFNFFPFFLDSCLTGKVNWRREAVLV